jgi:hypothetical protein
MCIVNDPTSFIGEAKNLNVSDTDFLFIQIAEIKYYVEQFPIEERQSRALEWIATYAEQYRQNWQKKVALEALAQSRCPDCTLLGGDRLRTCMVHTIWLDLLRRYADDEMSSQEYIEDAMQLLNTQRDRLKISKSRCKLLEEHLVFSHN